MTAQLNTLLRLRQYEVDRCQARLAAALTQERALTERLDALATQLKQHSHELKSLTRLGQINIDAVRLRQQYVQTLKKQLASIEAEIKLAMQAIDAARQDLLTADQRRQIAEKLRERLLQESKLRKARAEFRDAA